MSGWHTVCVAWRMCWAVARKEWLQLRQDRLTLALLGGVPLAQILLFGFAIVLVPRHWPAAWVAVPASAQTQAAAPAAPDAALNARLTQAMRQQLGGTGLLALPAQAMDAESAQRAMQRGDVRWVLHWPSSPSAFVLSGQPVPVFAADPLSACHACGIIPHGIARAGVGSGLAAAALHCGGAGGPAGGIIGGAWPEIGPACRCAV